MAAKTLPSQEYLRQCFDYDPETGVLTWRVRPRGHFKCNQSWAAANSKCSGAVAGRPITDTGGKQYLYVMLNFRMWRVHRLIWILVNAGADPPTIDHMNGDGLDNRLCNLRPASRSENQKNTKTRQSLYGRGVYQSFKKFAAKIRVGPGIKKEYLGSYNTPEEAHAAYERASLRLHGKFSYLLQVDKQQ
jgi:hypothetical protein